MKILCISDTHGLHEDLKISENIDMIIHAGDISNTRNPGINSNECSLFLNWYDKLNIKYKILIAGNHDTSIEAKYINPKDFKSIIYLEHESIIIEGINIFGSPYTPSFGEWAFMKKRGKLNPYWEEIPENTDILITHGPPKGILDLSYNSDNILEYCGCKELYNHVLRVQPKYHIFGHIHNFEDCYNSGKRTINNIQTEFLNVSCITDRKFDEGLTSKGIIITI